MKAIRNLCFAVIGLLMAFVVPSDARVQGTECFALVVGVVGLFLFINPPKQRAGFIAGVVSQYGLQAAYENAKKTLRNAGLDERDIDNAVLSPSELRLEQLLGTTANVINFPILDNASGSAAIRPTEKRLAQQDAFICNNIGIYLAKATSATDTAFNLDTYPNIVTFPVGGVVPAPLNTFYNGRLNITINKSQIIVDYPVMNFYQVPQTQRIATATPAVASQFDPAQVGLWQPTVNFIGSKGNVISITMPSNVSAVDTFTYIVIKLQGILAQNVTTVS